MLDDLTSIMRQAVHDIGSHVPQQTRVQSALDDEASNIFQPFDSRDEGSKCVGRRGE